MTTETDIPRARAALAAAYVCFVKARVRLVYCSLRLAEAEGRADPSELEAFQTRIKRAMRRSTAAKRLSGVQDACRGAEVYLGEVRAR